MDAAAWQFVIPAALVGLWVLFSVGLPQERLQEPPAQPTSQPAVITVEREALIMRVDRECYEIEGRLHAGGLTQAAEGAALVRSRMIEFLKGYK
jgi:hypothetical protein